MARALPRASLAENARFNALVVVPYAVQGLFRRRPGAVRAATRVGVDRMAVRLLGGMRHKHGPGPVWIRLLKDPALLVLSREDVERVLGGSPDPFAPDPPAKRDGMVTFQPDALTLSRDGAWENRRRFTEAVLDTGRPLHRLADRFAAVAHEEGEALLRACRGVGGELDWEPWHRAFRLTTRRIVLGDSARDDEELSELLAELMSEANGMPGKPSDRLDAFMGRLRHYVAAGEEGSLVSLFAEAPSDDETKVVGQIPHWLFAMQDTLAINTLRCLALLGSHPRQLAEARAELERTPSGLDSAAGVGSLSYLEACLEEAMRLWPTTPMLSRQTIPEVDWDGAAVPVGTQIVIVNTFLHRDRESHDFADRFAPEAWTDGDAEEDWSFNHLSHGPQGCPGSALALFVGRAMLATVLSGHRPRLVAPRIDPGRPLPHMLDFFSVRVALEPAD
jgi:cytochrome P450